MKKIQELVAVVLDNKEAYQHDKVFIEQLKTFKKGFLSEKNKHGDTKYLWHRNVQFFKAKSGIEIPPTPKLYRKADLFFAIHRSQIVNLLQELAWINSQPMLSVNFCEGRAERHGI